MESELVWLCKLALKTEVKAANCIHRTSNIYVLFTSLLIYIFPPILQYEFAYPTKPEDKIAVKQLASPLFLEKLEWY